MRTKRLVVLTALILSPRLLFAQVLVGPGGRQLTAPASTSKPEDRCILQGRVVNALTGEPLRKATVRLMRTNSATTNDGSQPPQGYSTTSEADGSFKMENIEPGDYHLSGERTGYLSTQYGAKGLSQRGTTIGLRPGQQVTDILLGVTPQAVLSGKVVDQDGDPVNGANIQLVAQTWQRGKLRHQPRNGGNTNDLGEYRIANVRPGKYYLVVQRVRFGPNNDPPPEPGKPDIRPVRTYYPEAPSLESATQLDVKAGQDLTGLDIRLRTAATYHIRGKVVGPMSDREPLNVNVSARGEQDVMFMFGGGGTVEKDRTFDIAGIAPGSYRLNLHSMKGQPRPMGYQDVEVGQGDLNDVQVMIIQPGTLHGQVVLEGNPQPGSGPPQVQNTHVNIQPVDQGTMMFGNNDGPVKEDGTFAIDGISPGKYYLNVNAPQGTYLKSVRFGSEDVIGRSLDLPQGSGQVTLVFSYGTAEIDGTVQRPQSNTESASANTAPQTNAIPDVSVVLIPDTLNEDGSGMQFRSAGAAGSFTVRGVRPGHYRAYAFEELEFQQLQNPELLKQLESKGTVVELNANDKKQIQLPLITADEMRQICGRLGIEVGQ